MNKGESHLPGVDSNSTEAFVAENIAKMSPFQAQTLKLVAEGELSQEQARENLVLVLNDKDKGAALDFFDAYDLYLNGVFSDEEFKVRMDEIFSIYK